MPNSLRADRETLIRTWDFVWRVDDEPRGHASDWA